MDIRPILSSLRKHKIPVALIVLEIALAFAVFCNAVFMIGQRVSKLDMPDAIAENGLAVISVAGVDRTTIRADMSRNLLALRRLSGVVDASSISSVPFGDMGFTPVDSLAVSADAKRTRGASVYLFAQEAPKTLGLKLLKGRFFNTTEYADSRLDSNMMPSSHVVLVTRSLARHLWPGQDALGKSVWGIGGAYKYTVVGIVEDVARPSSPDYWSDDIYDAAFFPTRPVPVLSQYLVRTTPQHLDRVLHASVAKLQALSPHAVVTGRTFMDMRGKAFASARSMVVILVLVCVVMLAVTAFGIVGLSSFWVRQRHRQIGVRRAVGATRGHVARYFQVENFLLSSAGIVLGMGLAVGINLYLMQRYELPRLPWFYLPLGAVALWLLGQLAVLAPALRASRVPPVVATRSV